MAIVISCASQKGGVAKTTTVIHLGVAIGDLGKKVLLLDMDPQGHVSHGFGIVADELPLEMSDVLDGSRRMMDIIISAIRPNVDLAPANIRLADMELTLVNMRFRETKLKRAIEPVLRHYDYILIDCPPSLGLLTVNALIASNQVIIPMATQYYSMLGVSLLLRTVNTIAAEANQALTIRGIIHTRHTKTVHAREVISQTKAELGEQLRVFETPIPESTRFAEATGQGKTIYELAPDNPGAAAYRRIAQEIVHD